MLGLRPPAASIQAVSVFGQTDGEPGRKQLRGDWYLEDELNGYVQGLRVKKRLLSVRTPFQALQIIDTDPFGRALILDDALQTTEWDEFMYHEMLVHVPMMTHPAATRVLIIGGGDGGALRRVLEYRDAEPVQVELDGAVIDACKEYLPGVSAGAFDNPRARIVIGDGIQFMRENPGVFDLVIVDSTDPVGPAVGLFREAFYQDVASALAVDGMLVAQSSSPLLMVPEVRAQVANLRAVFPIVRTYLGIVTGYPGGVWSYTIGSKQYDPCLVSAASIERRLAAEQIGARYYTPEVHLAAFALPRFVEDITG